MPPDEIEVSTEPEKKDEPPVTFVETDGDTLVTVGEEKKDGGARNDEERWRAAEANQNRLASDFADLRSRLAGVAGNPSTQPSAAADPWKAQEDAITEQERALGIQWEAHKAARQLTNELVKEFDQKSRQLHQQRTDIAAQRAMSNLLPQFIAASQEQHYRTQYGDVRSNPAANRWARGHYDMLVAQGAPESPETVDRAMNAARAQFRMATARSQPTDQDRQQLIGYSGNSRKNMEPKNNVVKMGKSEKIMAMSMYGERFNGDEKKVYAQWARGPGIKAQKAAQKARSANR
jgi:hypothetical protein